MNLTPKVTKKSLDRGSSQTLTLLIYFHCPQLLQCPRTQSLPITSTILEFLNICGMKLALKNTVELLYFAELLYLSVSHYSCYASSMRTRTFSVR